MQPEPTARGGAFPQTIVSQQPIDENLLHFWRAAKEDSDPIRAFSNNYMILESAAFFHIDQTVKKRVRKCLLEPNASDNLELWMVHLLEAIGEKPPEHERLQQVLKDCVDPKLIWQELAKDLDFFCKTFKFDGGFISEPLFPKGKPTEDQFSANWEAVFEPKIRRIRNALAHGKEQKTLATISPTTRNFGLLEKWVPVMAVAAREVMLYRELT